MKIRYDALEPMNKVLNPLKTGWFEDSKS